MRGYRGYWSKTDYKRNKRAYLYLRKDGTQALVTTITRFQKIPFPDCEFRGMLAKYIKGFGPTEQPKNMVFGFFSKNHLETLAINKVHFWVNDDGKVKEVLHFSSDPDGDDYPWSDKEKCGSLSKYMSSGTSKNIVKYGFFSRKAFKMYRKCSVYLSKNGREVLVTNVTHDPDAIEYEWDDKQFIGIVTKYQRKIMY